MILADILALLPTEEKSSLAQQLKLADDSQDTLEGYLLDHSFFQHNLQTISRRMRQIFESVCLADGDIELSEIRQHVALTRHDLRLLRERGMVFMLPSLASPKKLVVPLEYFAFPETCLPGKHRLIEALRKYPINALHRIAKFNQLPATEPRARYVIEIYQFLLEKSQLPQKTDSDQHKIINILLKYGGQMSVNRFQKQLFKNERDLLPQQPFTLDNLLAVNQIHHLNPLQKLFLSGILIPIIKPDAETISELSISAELYAKTASQFNKIQQTARAGLEEKMAKATSDVSFKPRETTWLSDIKSLILLIENQQPRATQDNEPFKSDLRRFLPLLSGTEVYVSFLFQFAQWLGIIKIDGGKFRVTPAAVEYIRLEPKKQHLLTKEFIDEKLPELFSENILQYTELSQFVRLNLSQFSHQVIVTADLLELARVTPEFRHLYDDFSKFPIAFQEKLVQLLQIYHWLGFIETDAYYHHFRATSTARYALFGFVEKFATPPPEESLFIIQPNFEIIAVNILDFEIQLQLARISTLVSLDITIRFQLNKALLLNCAQSQMTVADLRDFLTTHSKTSLPQTIDYFLNDLATKEGEVQLTPVAGLLHFNDPHQLEEARILLGDSVETIDGTNILVVKSGVDLDRIEKKIQHKGFFIQSHKQPAIAKTEEADMFKEHLDMLQIPAVNTSGLPFENPATNSTDCRRLLEFAVDRQIDVIMEYRNEGYAATQRHIIPKRINDSVLEGFCFELNMVRTFRLDHIISAELQP
ncbi:helicase-associated domain-containing protein [bacterium]|nr:helicase-associated domain-containing protein [bacterium]